VEQFGGLGAVLDFWLLEGPLLEAHALEVHCESRALALLGGDGDGATHFLEDGLADGEAEAAALQLLVVLAFEGPKVYKQVLESLLAHAVALVFDSDVEVEVLDLGLVAAV
jgi:hypothetical protein